VASVMWHIRFAVFAAGTLTDVQVLFNKKLPHPCFNILVVQITSGILRTFTY